MTSMTVFGDHEPNTLAQLAGRRQRAPTRAALMADGHLGYVMPIGGVAAYREQVSVVGVGFDIACGNAAIRTDLARGRRSPRKRLDAAGRRDPATSISFGVGRKNRPDDAPVDHPLFERRRWDAVPAAREARPLATRRARSSARSAPAITTSTSSPTKRTRSGSACTSARAVSATRSPPASWRSPQGQKWGDARARDARRCSTSTSRSGEDYWALMKLAGGTPTPGASGWRARSCEMLGGASCELVHNHHNFAWKEQHVGESSSSCARARRRRFPVSWASSAARWATTPSSCAAPEGDAETDALQRQRAVLDGARRRTRDVALGGGGQGESPDRPGAAPRQAGHARADATPGCAEGRRPARRRARREPARLSPADDVLGAQPGIEVLHTLRPLVVVMAGADELDPYKD